MASKLRGGASYIDRFMSFGTSTLLYDVVGSQKIFMVRSSIITATNNMASNSKKGRKTVDPEKIITSADGGMDDELVQYVLDEFKREHGIDLKQNTYVMSRILQAVAKARCDLYVKEETEVYVDYDDGEPKDLRVKLHRSFIEIIPVKYNAMKYYLNARENLVMGDTLLAGENLWGCISYVVREFYGMINIGIENHRASKALFEFAVDHYPGKDRDLARPFDAAQECHKAYYKGGLDYDKLDICFDGAEFFMKEFPKINHNEVKKAIDPYVKLAAEHTSLNNVKFSKANVGCKEEFCDKEYNIDYKAT